MIKQFVSRCCNAEIEKRHGKFSPDNSGFYIHTSFIVCSKCEEENPEEIESCHCCGEGDDNLIDTKLGLWCKSCVEIYCDDLMERV